jgi:hypothetical protein
MIESQEGATLNWRGTNYPCVAGPDLGGKLLGSGGYRVSAQQILVLRLAVLPPGINLPEEKQTITYKQTPEAQPQTVRIEALNTVANALLVMECNNPNQG